MYTVGPKGQVVITKEIREKQGIEPGWIALQLWVEDHLEVRFLPPSHKRSLAGALGPYIDEDVKKRLANKDWHEITEAAWEATAKERGVRLQQE